MKTIKNKNKQKGKRDKLRAFHLFGRFIDKKLMQCENSKYAGIKNKIIKIQIIEWSINSINEISKANIFLFIIQVVKVL